MAAWESYGYATDDVTWPWKVKVMNPIRLEANISNTAGDRRLVPIQMITSRYAYGESNSHVLDDVTCLVFLFGTD